MKNPNDFILVSDGSDPGQVYRDDRQIINMFRRDGDTTVLHIENFKDSGNLKYYR